MRNIDTQKMRRTHILKKGQQRRLPPCYDVAIRAIAGISPDHRPKPAWLSGPEESRCIMPRALQGRAIGQIHHGSATTNPRETVSRFHEVPMSRLNVESCVL
jgi:hypothetical protein